MAERTTLQTMSGAALSITATRPATFDSTAYGALTWTAVGEIENFGAHGVTKNVSTFTNVASAVVQKLPGAKDYGTMNLILGALPSDAGQDLIEAAVESTNRYSVKIAYPAGQGETTGEIHYLDVLVTKREWQDGSVDDVRKIAVDLALCRAPVVTAGT